MTVVILPTYFILARYDVYLYSIDYRKTLSVQTRFNFIILTQYLLIISLVLIFFWIIVLIFEVPIGFILQQNEMMIMIHWYLK